jgi:aminoglycoside phosphotransferase (APT) family kinase protein
VEGFELELAVLGSLAPQLPLPIPVPAYVGAPADGYPWPFFGAELVPGRELGELGEDARAALARPLAGFLQALHAASLDARLPEERMEMDALVPEARRRFAASTWAAPPVVLEVLDAAAELPPLVPSVVCHGDLHFRHLLVDGHALSGVIDWGDLCRGDPAVDLMGYWFALPAWARPDFVDTYGPVREDQLLRARVWALYVGAVLLAYALDVGDERLAREARGSLERAAC